MWLRYAWVRFPHFAPLCNLLELFEFDKWLILFGLVFLCYKNNKYYAQYKKIKLRINSLSFLLELLAEQTYNVCRNISCWVSTSTLYREEVFDIYYGKERFFNLKLDHYNHIINSLAFHFFEVASSINKNDTHLQR